MDDIKYIENGGLLFNDNRLRKDLEERCHMVYTVNSKVYRCCELATHELKDTVDWEQRYLYNIESVSRRFCNQHTIQLKISNDFKGKKFVKI